MDADRIAAREGGLKRSLTSRQLTMIGLGGAIGTGLFMGSGIAIAYAGPGVLVSYVIAGFIALTVMYSLSAGEWPEVRAHLEYQLARPR